MNPFNFHERFVWLADDETTVISPQQARRTFVNGHRVHAQWHDPDHIFDRVLGGTTVTYQSWERMMDLEKLVDFIKVVTGAESQRHIRSRATARYLPATNTETIREQIFFSGTGTKNHSRLVFGKRDDGVIVPKFSGFFHISLAEAQRLSGPDQIRFAGSESSVWLVGTESYRNFFWGPTVPERHTFPSYVLWEPDAASLQHAQQTIARQTRDKVPRGWELDDPIVLADGSLNEERLTATKGRATREI